MAEDSAISWTHHTFNPWWGCVKISPACTNCYAATFDHRLGGDHWGPKSERKFFGEKHWREPLKWNASAEKRGVRERVFCASMADVFEDRPELVEHRVKLWRLIDSTPNLDWLLLTKRPENIESMLPGPFMRSPARAWHDDPWPNVWLGATVENQKYADERIPYLLRLPAVVRFLSMEPLLEKVDLWSARFSTEPGRYTNAFRWGDGIGWVIVGCESGHGARSSSVEWYRAIRDECAAGDAAFFLKQATEDTRTIQLGDGSKRKASGVIELPYLDGVQHAAVPR